MDPLTKAAFIVDGVLFVAATWWYVQDEVKQRRRGRAEPLASQQVSNTDVMASENTVPLTPLPVNEEDPPALFRPYIWDHGDTKEIPKVTDLGPRTPDS